ncbi:hypothetical protein [Cellulomonas sp. NPDC058312]|uniref:hypothetical protein n=1 Tax=Cellulomonas sp. NPDC058312 TaxID=3346441 RepID=UPI0036E30B6B
MDRIEQEFEDNRRRRELVQRDPMVQQAVARFMVTADAGLGIRTPQWVRDLAESGPAYDDDTYP